MASVAFKGVAARNDGVSVVGVVGATSFICTSIFMQNAMGSLGLFQAERPVFLREYASQMYGVLPYYFGKTTVELPVLLAIPIIPLLITYWALGFATDAELFFKLFLTFAILVQSASSMGYVLSTLFTNFETAALVASATLANS